MRFPCHAGGCQSILFRCRSGAADHHRDQGQVTNEAGAPRRNATVTVTDTRTGSDAEITTNAEGLFARQGLSPAGPTPSPRPRTASRPDGRADQHQPQGATQLTFSLSGSGRRRRPSSSPRRASARPSSPSAPAPLQPEVLENAPTFNRDVRDIIRLDPRVSLDRESDGGSGQDRISCLGGNDRGNAFTVDGIRRATSTASTTPASRRAARPRSLTTRSARPRSSSPRSTSSTATSPAARSTS